MKQVAQNLRNGEIRLLEIPVPAVRPHGVLVRTARSLISAGTERSKVELGQSSLLAKARKRPDDVRKVLDRVRRDGLLATYEMVKGRLEKPSPLGYSSAGTVLAVGELVCGVKPGDRVACAGAGYANHAEAAYVPGNLCVRIPDGVDFEAACFTTVGAIAMQGIRQAGVVVGDTVVVLGLGLVGQLAVRIANAAGCRTLGIDLDASKVELATASGATSGATIAHDDALAKVAELSGGRGADAVIITASTASSDPVVLAGRLCRDRGVVVVVGNVGLNIPRNVYYEKELDLRLSRSYGPGRYDPLYEEYGIDYPEGFVRWTERRNMEEFLRLVAAGDIDVARLVTHRFPIAEVKSAYELVTGKSGERFIGVVLEYAADAPSSPVSLEKAVPAVRARGGAGVAMVGAGNFATATLLPALRGVGVSMRGIMASSGLSASAAASRFGFAYCTSELDRLASDETVDGVVIATRHTSHAEMVVKFLGAGKHVFVEKPLAVSMSELESVVSAWKSSAADIMVGFNRRFAPATVEVKRELARLEGPTVVQCRVNAGALPDEHWTQSLEEGAGRIVGELCHFIDLAGYLVGSTPASVYANAVRNGKSAALQDSVVVSVSFADGSVASIVYEAEGDTAYGKELVEVFRAGGVWAIDDFRVLTKVRSGRRDRRDFGRVDKGHADEMAAFAGLLRGEASNVLTFTDCVNSTVATLAVISSLSTGQAIPLLPALPGG